jgi:hypothetical protein
MINVVGRFFVAQKYGETPIWRAFSLSFLLFPIQVENTIFANS